MSNITIMPHELNQILTALGAIQADIKNIKERLDRLEDNQEKRLDKAEERISALEKWVWKSTGIAIAISTGIGYLIKFI